jgi:hypothetical protein
MCLGMPSLEESVSCHCKLITDVGYAGSRLDFHAWLEAIDSVTWMARALLDNDPVNIRLLSYATIERCYAFHF